MLTTSWLLEEATKSLIHLVLLADCRSANLRSVPKRQVSFGKRWARVSPFVLTITLHTHWVTSDHCNARVNIKEGILCKVASSEGASAEHGRKVKGYI